MLGASGKVPVLVEVRAAQTESLRSSQDLAASLYTDLFTPDPEFVPVPVSPREADRQSMAVARERAVIVRGEIEPDRIDELRALPGVLSVHLDTPIAPFEETPSSAIELVEAPAFGSCPIPPCDCQPSEAKGTLADVARHIGADAIWATGNRGEGIIVGVVDGGLTAEGRTASGEIPRVIGGWPQDWGKRADWGRHGNMSATDVLGIAPAAALLDIRVSSDGSVSTVSRALAGYQWALERYRATGTPHILTNSWGIYQKSWDPIYATDVDHPFTRKVVEAMEEGILVLFAAGNCGGACPSNRCGADTGEGRSIWGANGHPGVMTVSASNIRDEFIGYSSQGPAALSAQKPDFCGISHFKGYFSSDTGTSAACPVAAGAVALLKQRRSSLTQARVKTLLMETAHGLGVAGWDQHSGAGVIRAKAAFDHLQPAPEESREQRLARRALERWRETDDLRYLCLYYHYLAEHYRKLHLERREWADLARHYRLRELRSECAARITGALHYRAEVHRYMALYWRVCFENTRVPDYWKNYRREARFYRELIGRSRVGAAPSAVAAE